MDSFLSHLEHFQGIPGIAYHSFIPKKVGKNEIIFTEGENPDAVYVLKEGLVKTIKHVSDDVISTIDFILPGKMLGMIAAMDNQKYPVSAVAMRQSEIIRIPIDQFQSFLHSSSEFRKGVFREIGTHVRNSQSLRTLMQKPVEQRIAHILSYLYDVMGPHIQLLREDIAAMAGCTPPTAVRMLIRFRKEKIIQTGWKKIKIISPQKLAALLS